VDERVAGDPRVVRSRAALVEAASAHFLERGYLEANLDDIALEAGVAKRTIYNVYGGKEQLFREILAEAVATAEWYSSQVVAELGTPGARDVEVELREAGLRLARAVLGGRIVPLRRLLIAEARRFPELAADYYERAPGRVMGAIAEALRRVDERGELRIPDPRLAAEQFAFLVIGASLDRALFDAAARPHATELVEARALAGVEVFLRAHAPQGREG
jgi:TetR/AcrR family transcriptional regulator, mexJK operon transcriptional repressor